MPVRVRASRGEPPHAASASAPASHSPAPRLGATTRDNAASGVTARLRRRIGTELPARNTGTSYLRVRAMRASGGPAVRSSPPSPAAGVPGIAGSSYSADPSLRWSGTSAFLAGRPELPGFARSRLARAPGSQRAPGPVEPRLAQLRAGRAVTELLARPLAVARPDDVAQVGVVLERVAVLLGVALRAQVVGRGARDRERLLQPALG